MSRIIFNVAAKCDRAGRAQNQDNYWICPDLSLLNSDSSPKIGNDTDIELSEKGTLLVVADGMGGMNAGEIASMLVVESIKKHFSSVPNEILSNEVDILDFIKESIIDADNSIKQYAKEHKEAEGLGSTIVLLWLLNGKAYCGWCGDSRIYRFNPNNELVRLSHDHSYVQSLVDEGKISEEEAFNHPDGNIITKSLGDNGETATPELRVYDIYQRDVFILCSDGLCGLLTDSEINETVESTCTSSKDSLEALWEKGQATGWTDNVTIDILCVSDGGKPAKGRPDGYPRVVKKQSKNRDKKVPIVNSKDSLSSKNLKFPYIYIIGIVSICVLGIVLYFSFVKTQTEGNSNFEFNVEVLNQETDESDTNINDDSSSSHSSSQANNNHQNGRNRDHRRNQTTTHGARQTNTGSSNNTTQNQGTQTQDNSPINSGVINQLPQNNNGHNTNIEQRPSVEYTQLFNNVLNDYNKAKKAWGTIKQQKYKTRRLENMVLDFTDNINKNIAALERDKANYNALKEKNRIKDFKKLYDEIKHDWRKYDNYQPSIHGGGNEMGSQEYL